ncbi:MAG TPA: hypothetical protein VGM93_03365, partial [Acidimicrobiales bacterium]
MTEPGGPAAESTEPVRPRTIAPDRPRGTAALRPRTIGALGRPSPVVIPTVGSFLETTVGSATGQLPVISVDEPYEDVGVTALEWALDDHPADRSAELAERHRAAADRGPDADADTDHTADADGEPDDELSSRRLIRNNLFVASGTAASRLTGFIRTGAIATLLIVAVHGSTGQVSDTYLLANNTPNIIYELILGGVL